MAFKKLCSYFSFSANLFSFWHSFVISTIYIESFASQSKIVHIPTPFLAIQWGDFSYFLDTD
ncbi:hypothetical protein [Helicobacter pylori]|uniref:hypothetical protein n=1 Tax=Helicobacter pylori TaxID=210 RepID=UPI00165AD760|nr:hypothetical protein [Helicobacter pylori]